MNRRHVLAAGGSTVAAALGGCLSGDSQPDEIGPEQVTVSGVDNSSFYTNAGVRGLDSTDHLFSSGAIELALTYPIDSEHDPRDHDVFLMDGSIVLVEGRVKKDLFEGEPPYVSFFLSRSDLNRDQPLRVVSTGAVEPVDEFELTIQRTDDTDS